MVEKEINCLIIGILLGSCSQGSGSVMASGREHRTEGRACQSNILENQL
jgi:hypothetical protein